MMSAARVREELTQMGCAEEAEWFSDGEIRSIVSAAATDPAASVVDRVKQVHLLLTSDPVCRLDAVTIAFLRFVSVLLPGARQLFGPFAGRLYSWWSSAAGISGIKYAALKRELATVGVFVSEDASCRSCCAALNLDTNANRIIDAFMPVMPLMDPAPVSSAAAFVSRAADLPSASSSPSPPHVPTDGTARNQLQPGANSPSTPLLRLLNENPARPQHLSREARDTLPRLPSDISVLPLTEISGSIEVCLNFQRGKGSNDSRVMLGRKRDSVDHSINVAIKHIPLASLEDARREALAHRDMHRKFSRLFVQVHEVVEASRDVPGAYLVMELCNSSLEQWLPRRAPLCWEDKLFILQSLCQAVDCLHTDSMVHRDIRPANVLISQDGYVKLGDFGISQSLPAVAALDMQTRERLQLAHERCMHEAVHTNGLSGVYQPFEVLRTLSSVRAYMPPEVADTPVTAEGLERRRSTPASMAVDIFILGMTICYVVFDGRHLPFGSGAVDYEEQIRYIGAKLPPSYLYSRQKTMDPALFYLLMWMLEHESKDRPTSRELLAHPFFRSFADRESLVTALFQQYRGYSNSTDGRLPSYLCDERISSLLAEGSSLPRVPDDMPSEFRSVIRFQKTADSITSTMLRLLHWLRHALQHGDDMDVTPRRTVVQDCFGEGSSRTVMEVLFAHHTTGWFLPMIYRRQCIDNRNELFFRVALKM
jgi:serine/threonine protein kinase